MTHAIAITRSELRQVIEDYIAASRVGDTLSYVETAKLSTAEAAESSTSRIWDGLGALACNARASLCTACISSAGAAEPAMSPRELMLSAALAEAATLLRKYETHHRAKADPSGESLRKAEVNAQHAARYEALLDQGQVELPKMPPSQIEQVFPEPKEFTCAEDLAAGQVVIVNSRGMIEGKRDEADKIVMSEHPVVSYDFGFFQAEQLHGMFSNDTDAKVRVDFMPDGKVFAWDHSPDVAPIELTDTVGGEPESADDFF